jgi:undecaprenyl diphosphate synthase
MTLETLKANGTKIPTHIAVIMDGNGRWANQHGQERTAGHQEGVNAVREITRGAREAGVKYLTLYTFSTENWNRPQEEIDFLMELLVYGITQEIDDLIKNGIKLSVIGDISRLPEKSASTLKEAFEKTKNNTELNLILALNYSGKSEIIQAVKNISTQVLDSKIKIDEIDEHLFSNALYTKDIPDPELLIRTSGEHRLSNFLLWQLAYSEFYFTDKLWPDFKKEDFFEAIADYQGRERRFGKTGDQVKI